MATANPTSHDDGTSAPVAADTPLFKEDRPRHIDRYISFFGEEGDASPMAEPQGFALADRWSSEP